MVPDIFSDYYYEMVRNALKHVDSLSLSNLLVGRVFNVLFRYVFANKLESHSFKMVDIVKDYMEGVLNKLFEKASGCYPGQLNKIKAVLLQDIMEKNHEITVKGVSNVVAAELSCVFT